jgi:hypothetical protein
LLVEDVAWQMVTEADGLAPTPGRIMKLAIPTAAARLTPAVMRQGVADELRGRGGTVLSSLGYDMWLPCRGDESTLG